MLARVADSLYWMARYLERAEHTARLLAVKLDSLADQTEEDAEAGWHRVASALTGEQMVLDPFAITDALSFDHGSSASLISSLRFARDNARQVRDHLSNEMWEHLNRLYLRLQDERTNRIWSRQPSQFFRRIMEDLYTLEGITYTTLRHGEGWHFLELGRYIERAQLISRLLDIHFGIVAPGYENPPPRPKYGDWLILLKYCTAFEPYLKEHTADVTPETIAEFLLFDAEFPHSVRFAVDRMRESLSRVAPGAPPTRRAVAERLAGRLKAAVDYGQIDDLTGGSIDTFLAGISKQCEQVHEAVYSAYVGYDAEAVL